MTEPLRIGVIGATSTIARNAVIPAIAAVEGARVTAVASRSDAAALLSEHHPAMHVHDDYARVLDDPDVDAVYIPLPNHLHAEWTVRAAAAGKHVLCEKPLARSADEARAMATACTDADVVLMEAYMTPYHPRNVAVREWLDSGGLGALRHGFARFTGTVGPDNHRWRPEMGGGALLDLGVYCLEPLLSAAGWGHTGTRATTDTTDIAEMAAHAVVVETGVDATFSGWLRMDSGATLSFVCSFEAPEHQRVELVGVDAAVSIDRAFTTERGGARLRRRAGQWRATRAHDRHG